MIPGVGTIAWSRIWQQIPAFWPGEFHGQRSLAGYSPSGHEESDATEHARTAAFCCACSSLEAGSCLPLLTAVSAPASNSPSPAVYRSHILKSDKYGENDTFLCKRKVNILKGRLKGPSCAYFTNLCKGLGTALFCLYYRDSFILSPHCLNHTLWKSPFGLWMVLQVIL